MLVMTSENGSERKFRTMKRYEDLKKAADDLENVINQAYELDEELDLGSFLERLEDIKNDLDDILDDNR